MTTDRYARRQGEKPCRQGDPVSRWLSDCAMTLEILTVQCPVLTNGSKAHSSVDGAGCADVVRTRA